MDENERYRRAKEKVEELKGFYVHAVVYVLVNILLLVINTVTFDGYWWFWYPLAGWGVGLIIHSLMTFTDGVLGQDWEERKIKEYMNKDKEY